MNIVYLILLVCDTNFQKGKHIVSSLVVMEDIVAGCRTKFKVQALTVFIVMCSWNRLLTL